MAGMASQSNHPGNCRNAHRLPPTARKFQKSIGLPYASPINRTAFLEHMRREALGYAEDLIRPHERVVAPDALVALQGRPWQEVSGWTGKQYRGDPESGVLLVDPLDAPPLQRAGFRREANRE